MIGKKLPPIDVNGVGLRAGMHVRILTIPDWLIHDLPPEEVGRLMEVKGTVMQIAKFDEFGYAWFGDWFCLRPNEVCAEL